MKSTDQIIIENLTTELEQLKKEHLHLCSSSADDQDIIEHLEKEIQSSKDVLTNLANSAACLYSDTTDAMGESLGASRQMLRGDLRAANELLNPAYKERNE
jgi:hypothetical protein